jgi:sulfite oxidase
VVTTIPHGRAALAGLLAAVAGLAAGELVAGLLGQATTSVLAVGAAFIDVIPDGVREFGIQLLGTADKPVLVAGILVVLAGLAALAGVVGARSRAAGTGILVVLALVGVVAAATRPDAGPAAVAPSVVTGLVAVLMLPWLLGTFTRVTARPGPAASTARLDRRALLRTSGLVVAGSAVAAGAGQVARVYAGRRQVADARTAVRLPTHLPTPPAAPDLDVAGLTPWRTPNDAFYRIDTALAVPTLDPSDWRLRIHGMVDRPLELTFAELLRRPAVNRYVTLTCVSNTVGGDLAGNALWTGVRVADLLAETGVHPDADAVKSTSEDGWTCGTPLTALTDGRDALLAYAMNGAALPFEHGFPVRMVVPGLYGYVSATKWIVDIEVTRFDRFRAYWTDRGWAPEGPIKTASRIDVPRAGTTVDAGRVAVAGVAWAQHRGIARVVVQVDDGPWHQAELAGQPTEDAWRQWVWVWDARPGRHRLRVRATDGSGETQTGALAPPAPNGATGWHTVEVTVR